MSDDRIKKLQVKDLTISFRTINGKVQAVRDISFDLYKGETLAIVGESGSGKSVTSKAILGISAANAIIESGELLYDGMDLLKIGEDDYHKIRGDKISMIFQDPLSSLNPVMRIGNQITEAMILKNKASRRENRRKLNDTLKALADVMKATEGTNDDARFATFRKIMAQQARYEAPYTQARSSAEAALKAVDDMLLAIGKEALSNPVADANELATYLKAAVDPFVVRDKAAAASIADGLKKGAHAASSSKNKDLAALKDSALKAKAVLEEALAAEKPDFFALGAWIVLGGNTLNGESAADLKAKTAPYLGGEFMTGFRSDIKGALISSSRQSVTDMESAIKALGEAGKVFGAGMPEKAEAVKLAKEVSDSVEKAIDPFETVKTSFAYTFRVSLKSAIDVYYNDIERNRAEEKRFSRQ
ncbi:MAG: ABC transporter ATP-binding protein, partial [Spirochaetales bacterium]|nr:ABC transporter ATP-binding protein [Spirochaetales bacterium]